MITGGWTKDDNDYYLEYYPVKEVSFMCDKKELKSLIDFLSFVYNRIGDADETVKQYRDWNQSWKKGDSDVVIVVKPQGIV